MISAMRIAAVIVTILAIAVGLFAEERNFCSKGPHTLYSRRATDQGFGTKRIKSPDGLKMVSFRRVDDERDPDGWHTSFTVRVGKKTFRTKLLGFSAEVLWSSDSKAFAVTETEGGVLLRATYILRFFPTLAT
jgi:hypothetical protein